MGSKIVFVLCLECLIRKYNSTWSNHEKLRLAGNSVSLSWDAVEASSCCFQAADCRDYKKIQKGLSAFLVVSALAGGALDDVYAYNVQLTS